MVATEPRHPIPSFAWRGEDTGTVPRAIALVRAVRDPALPGLLVGCGLTVAGVMLLIFAAVGAASAPYLPLQVPYLVSGGFGGAALIAVGAVLAAIQAECRDRTIARLEMDQAVRAAALFAEHVLARRGAERDREYSP